MNIYIWKSVSALTSSWHDGGGCVVIAEDLALARKMIAEEAPKCEALTAIPDEVYAIKDASPKLFIFPDAGCC